MTPRMAAIFRTDPADEPAPAVVDPPVDEPFPDPADDSAEQLPDNFGATPAPASWPTIEGTEHFSLLVEDADGTWPAFIPGHHYDTRQLSRLRGLCIGRIVRGELAPDRN